MTPEEKRELRDLRDQIEDEADKRLLRKAINYQSYLERKLMTVRTLLRTAQNEAIFNNGGPNGATRPGEEDD